MKTLRKKIVNRGAAPAPAAAGGAAPAAGESFRTPPPEPIPTLATVRCQTIVHYTLFDSHL